MTETELAPKLKAFRVSRQMTVERLAADSGVPAHIVEKIERGEEIREGGAYVLALSRVMGLGIEEPKGDVHRGGKTRRAKGGGPWKAPAEPIRSPHEKSLQLGQWLIREAQSLAKERGIDPKHQIAEVVLAGLLSNKISYESDLAKYEGERAAQMAADYAVDSAVAVLVSALMVARESALVAGNLDTLRATVAGLLEFVEVGTMTPVEIKGESPDQSPGDGAPSGGATTESGPQ